MRIAGAFRRSDTMVSVMRAEDGSFVDVNPAFEAALGWRIEEVVGLRAVDIELWPDMEIRARLWARLRSEQSVQGEPVQLRARDGHVFAALLDVELIDHDGGLYVLCMARRQVDQPVSARGADDRGSYRALYLAATEGIYRSLPERGFIDVNPALASIFGYDSPEAMLRASTSDPARLYADAEHARLLYQRLLRDGRVEHVRSQVYRQDGSVIWISENMHVVHDDAGRVLFYEGSAVDITAEVAAENALRQSEALYRILVDNCRDGVFLIQRGKIVFANEALATMLGYAAEELFGTEYMSLVAPEEHAAQVQRRAQREAGSQEVQRYDIVLVRKSGERALFTVHADAVEFDGDIASAGLMRDVTEEYRQREALEKAERRYRELFEQSPVGLFRTHRDGRVLEVNPTMARLVGYDTPQELKQALPSMAHVYADPDERQQLIERVVRAGGVSDHEMQMIGRDGKRLWVSANVRLLVAEDGETHFAGSVQDISQRRAIEQALLRSEAKYRTLVEHSEVGVYVMQEDRLTYVNAAFASMLGYSERDLRGRRLEELAEPEQATAVSHYLGLRRQSDASAPELETCLLRNDGQRVYVTISVGPVELDGVAHVTGTVRDVTRHREAEQRLKFHATHDPLTGLPNRLLFQQRLGSALRTARETGDHSYAVLFLDLDGFKLVNDSLGHAAGDRLLVGLAEKLASVLHGEALVARYGGDEFTVLPTVPCLRERAEELADRILRLFAAPFDIGGQQVFSGSSVGIVLGRPEYRTPDQVLRDADTAMYRAKALGKSAHVVFDEEMHRQARARFELETDFRLAFERSEFCVHYQPIVDLATGALRGCEALVRWQHPERGMLLPAEFLPVAEESGLIAALDWWVLEEACRQAARWHLRYPRHAALHLNVNVDERQLAGRNLVSSVQAVLDETGIDPATLTLEVTETVFRSGREGAQRTLDRLKELGIGLAVDDFGTGYSSLDSFASSPFDALKIDRNFVRDVESNPRHRAIVRTITGFAADLGLALTAEGIETEGQRRLLLELHCRQGQGHLFSPALPADAFEVLLRAAAVPLSA